MKKALVRIIEIIFNTRLIEISTTGGLIRKNTIVDIKEGYTVYTLPWMFSPATGLIDLNAPIYDKPEGTACLPLTMKDGCIYVDVSFEYFGRKYEW